MELFDRLSARLDDAARAGHAAPLGQAAELALAAGALSARGRSRACFFSRATSAVALAPVESLDGGGLAAIVADGNLKDEASFLAAGLAAAALLDHVARPLISVADVGPMLRRVVLEAHERVVAAAHTPWAGPPLATVARPRTTSLAGIGTSIAIVALTPPWLHCTWVGDCSVWLLRGGRPRRLTQPHTLASSPDGRALIASGALEADDAKHVVTRVLGVTDDAPAFDVTRLELAPGDRVLLGNERLDDESAARLPPDPTPPAVLIDMLTRTFESEPYLGPPITLVAIGYDPEEGVRSRALR